MCRHIDRADLIDDPRFATAESIAEHTADAVAILARPSRPAPAGVERGGSPPWPGRGPGPGHLQAAGDAQIRANEYIIARGRLELVANPVQFDVEAPHTGGAPASRSRPTTCCSSSGWTGIASSSSRPPER